MNIKTELVAKLILRYSSDMAKFREILKSAKNVVMLTGAGISAESGIPTFRGEGGVWRIFSAESLASPAAFRDDPGLVWEFYHYRREVALKAKPNAGHIAIAEYEKRHSLDKNVTVVTQNVDGLHARAGTKNLIEFHGSLFKTRCTKCGEVLVNMDSPICEGLRGKGAPDPKLKSELREKDLPHCKKPDCGGLLRPHIVWFGETIDVQVFERAGEAMDKSEVCLVVGTSSLVYPAAVFAEVAAARGAIIAEFNLKETPSTRKYQFLFKGPSGKYLPQALVD